MQSPIRLADAIQTRVLTPAAGLPVRAFRGPRLPFAHGARRREARSGRSGQDMPPFAMRGEACTTKTRGCATALACGSSGGDGMVTKEVPFGRRRIQVGHAAGSEPLATHFTTATLARSDVGLNGCAVSMQTHVQDRRVPWPDRSRPHPVHGNGWAAVCFTHDLGVLSNLALRAARIGAERFVLDGGWFCGRADVTPSLGDWIVNCQNGPQGLQTQIDAVPAQGMTFGPWVAPERVNADSDLSGAPPDGIVGVADQVNGRPKLGDDLFHRLAALLTDHDIVHLKWDQTRLLPCLDAAQGRGIRAVLARLRAAPPAVEIESCAFGGGRNACGILAQTCRVWLPDGIEAVERLRMHAAVVLVSPSAIPGGPVDACKSHAPGRGLPIVFCAWMAAQRHMGFERDLAAVSPGDAAVRTRVTVWYEANRAWRMARAIHLLDAGDPAMTAKIQIAADGSRFVTFAGLGILSRQIVAKPLRMAGLTPDALCRITLLYTGDKVPHARRPTAPKTKALTLSGQALMTSGFMLPIGWPATLWAIEGTRLSQVANRGAASVRTENPS